MIPTKSINSLLTRYVGTLTILILLIGMDIANCRTVFNELIPSRHACSQIGDYGCICDKNVDCNSEKYLECIDGKCNCEFPRRRTFDPTLGKCVSLVGSFCGEYIPECIRNSECEGGRCTCRQGYGSTMNSSCSISFGEECGPNQCNVDRGLACKDGKCQCLDSSFTYSAIHFNCIDPEAIVQNFIQQLVEKIIRRLLDFKIQMTMNKVTRPLRILRRLTFGGFG